ncbi:unnamed protein product [Meloidogyne enterolobii]|uniref:Uncharacterized protein n=1 Tax=Meloidogyne enterolobii TaxID=390850 RepID=A0ACB0Z4H9_MELEN
MKPSGGFIIEKEDIYKIVKNSKYSTPYIDQEVQVGVDANGKGAFRLNFYGQTLILIIFRIERKYMHPQIIFAEIVAFLFNFVSCFGHMDFVALFEAGLFRRC